MNEQQNPQSARMTIAVVLFAVVIACATLAGILLAIALNG